ncbi:L-threonylcarbamoyladenylate synthase [Lacibacterium aquatile]|uniref:Threonylcarbamoyl-AMP synthase n=1 Tax=Lacibacterium aquatile TaxID=1168082 RepID=A0ABW5DRE5_9PROT
MPILSPTPENITEAARHLISGGLVGMPTETVYGLAADATNGRAVAQIYELKGRPAFNPLIIHVADVAAAEKLAVLDERAQFLARRLWPGALTLVLPRRADSFISGLATAGLDTIAIRIPDHGVALDLLRTVNRPLAAPSANLSGHLSPSLPGHVALEFGNQLGIILDGGPCRVGLESTVLDLTGPLATILRPGGITRETIEASIGPVSAANPHIPESPKSPGMLASHYAPSLPLRLDWTHPGEKEALLAFGPLIPEGFATVLNLSETGDLHEAAANLFAYLHALDTPEHSGIAVMPVPNQGLGIAINDRLKRAATPAS